MLEIERKFEVLSVDFKSQALSNSFIAQGYLNSHPERSVRVRIMDSKGFLTVKGISDSSGLSRFEWEIEIPETEAKELLKRCEPGSIEKTRYRIPIGQYVYEVDEFHGNNHGLVLAEIELDTPDAAFEKPDWLGKEVTGDKRFYNSYLAKHPYNTW